jgi:hypothetical protein
MLHQHPGASACRDRGRLAQTWQPRTWRRQLCNGPTLHHPQQGRAVGPVAWQSQGLALRQWQRSLFPAGAGATRRQSCRVLATLAEPAGCKPAGAHSSCWCIWMTLRRRRTATTLRHDQASRHGSHSSRNQCSSSCCCSPGPQPSEALRRRRRHHEAVEPLLTAQRRLSLHLCSMMRHSRAPLITQRTLRVELPRRWMHSSHMLQAHVEACP